MVGENPKCIRAATVPLQLCSVYRSAPNQHFCVLPRADHRFGQTLPRWVGDMLWRWGRADWMWAKTQGFLGIPPIFWGYVEIRRIKCRGKPNKNRDSTPLWDIRIYAIEYGISGWSCELRATIGIAEAPPISASGFNSWVSDKVPPQIDYHQVQASGYFPRPQSPPSDSWDPQVRQQGPHSVLETVAESWTWNRISPS